MTNSNMKTIFSAVEIQTAELEKLEAAATAAQAKATAQRDSITAARIAENHRRQPLVTLLATHETLAANLRLAEAKADVLASQAASYNAALWQTATNPEPGAMFVRMMPDHTDFCAVELERQVRALIALKKVELAAVQVEVLSLAKLLELEELLPVEMRKK